VIGAVSGWAWVWPALVIAGLVLLGYVGYRLARDRGAGPAAGLPSARRSLDERYARGEIDDDEYRRGRARRR
jgi:putative membrane protein